MLRMKLTYRELTQNVENKVEMSSINPECLQSSRSVKNDVEVLRMTPKC